MFRIITTLIIIVFIVRLIWISRSKGWDLNWWKKTLGQELSQLFLRIRMIDANGNLYKKLRYFCTSLSLFSFIILAITAIIPVVILNQHLSGTLLIIHVTIAPVFVVAVSMTALFWAHFKQFNLSDLQFINEIRDKKSRKNLSYHGHPFLSKLYFWIFLILSVPAALSIIVSMFPYFGTEGQNIMLNIHRYTTTGLLIMVFLYTDYKLIFSDLESKKE